MFTRRELLCAASSLGFAGCLSRDPGETGTETVVPSPGATGYWYTSPGPTRNRLIEGRGNLRDSDPVVLETEAAARWVVAYPEEEGSSWVVATEDGSVRRWYVNDGEATAREDYGRLPEGSPPVVATYEDGAGLVRPPEGMPVVATPTVAGTESPRLLYASGDGSLVVAERGGGDRGGDSEGSVVTTTFDVGALPDARIADMGDGRYALFGDATDRYRHGALGDETEGGSLVVYDSEGSEVSSRTRLSPPDVFEGLGPMAADVDGDGETEIVTTVANSSEGARIAVFGGDGERIATGPVHEPGWRHQLAVAPFGPDGGMEIAVVRKPHVERLVEFYRLRGGSLGVADSLGGFQSHTYGSRNLDGAVATDADDDGATELLVPTTRRDEIAAVRRSAEGSQVVWRKGLDGRMTSNITGVATANGVAVGVGDGSGVRVWQG